jgi:manganese/zinc/iron transport system substrate-binding protein
VRKVMLILIHALLLGACRREEPADSRPLVVCTTAMVADCAREIGGDAFRVVQLMGEGVDPHLYKPTPRDVALISEADLVLYSGLHLEGRLIRTFTLLPDDKTVGIADAIPRDRLLDSPDYPQAPDPHVWFDASLWSIAASRAADVLDDLHPQSAADIDLNLKRYLERLDRLHRDTQERISSIPAEKRVLVTAHDAFNYFSKAYGIEVRSIQGLSTEGEASLARVNELTTMLVERNIPAVFVESSVPPKTVRALIEGAMSKGARVVVGGELFSDAAGKPGTLQGTYIGMFTHNVEVITRALGGVTEQSP